MIFSIRDSRDKRPDDARKAAQTPERLAIQDTSTVPSEAKAAVSGQLA
jgi:hypothetical protein